MNLYKITAKLGTGDFDTFVVTSDPTMATRIVEPQLEELFGSRFQYISLIELLAQEGQNGKPTILFVEKDS